MQPMNYTYVVSVEDLEELTDNHIKGLALDVLACRLAADLTLVPSSSDYGGREPGEPRSI